MKIYLSGNFKEFIKSLMPSILLRFFRTINATVRFKGSERVAQFALQMKASGCSATFQKKILRKMAFDRDPRLSLYADKVLVREFVKERVGSKYLTTSFGVFSSIESLERNSFPKNFVLKSNHGSGASVICWEGAPRGVMLPKNKSSRIWQAYIIHPDDLVWEQLVSLSNSWMKGNFYWDVGRFPEWAYKGIQPQILAEEVLTHNGRIPEDYKFFMVNGECEFIQVRNAPKKRDLYSPTWDLLDARFLYPSSGIRLVRPIQLPEMVNIAKALSVGIDFIRVDMYVTDFGIKFGELTNYPDGGLADIKPKELSVELAKNWIQNY